MLTSIRLSEKNFFGFSCGMSKVENEGKLHNFELWTKLWRNFSPPFRVAPKLDASMQFSASFAGSRVRFEILPIKKFFLFRAEQMEISGKFQLFSAPNHFSFSPVDSKRQEKENPQRTHLFNVQQLQLRLPGSFSFLSLSHPPDEHH